MKIKSCKDRPTIKELDDLCRNVVRLRDKMTCRRCGKSKMFGWKVEWAHFYSRAIKTTRWDLDNSMILCFDCHYNFGHKRPREFAEWWEQELGEQRMNELRYRAKGKLKPDNYNLIKIYLEQEIKKHEK